MNKMNKAMKVKIVWCHRILITATKQGNHHLYKFPFKIKHNQEMWRMNRM